MFFFNLLLFAFEQKMQIYSLGQKILTPSQFSYGTETDVTAVFLKRFVIPYPYLPIFISLGKQIHVDTRHTIHKIYHGKQSCNHTYICLKELSFWLRQEGVLQGQPQRRAEKKKELSSRAQDRAQDRARREILRESTHRALKRASI